MKHLLTTKQAAEFLGVSEQFLERARWAGTPQIPFVRVGARAVRYDPDSLKQYLDDRVCYSTAQYDAQAA